MLFYLPVTEAWLNQLVLCLVLVCHSSFRGVVRLLEDLFDMPVSVGTVHNRLAAAAGCAALINAAQDLSPVRVGLHDEIFQGNQPVLAGIDAASTYCYLLAGAEHRDETTWGVHLLDAKAQGLNPDYTIADAGTGLRAGQRAALGETPCHGDIFHIQHQCEGLANRLARTAQGATTRRQQVEQRMEQAKLAGRGNTLSSAVAKARKAEAVALGLAKDVKALVGWLERDILALAGPSLGGTGVNSSTSSSPNWNSGNGWIPPESAPSASPSSGNAITCWASPRCLTASSRRLPNASVSLNIKSGPSACCSANPKPHRPTGSAATS